MCDRCDCAQYSYILSLYALIVYPVATSTTDTELLKDCLVLLFLNDTDEKVMTCINKMYRIQIKTYIDTLKNDLRIDHFGSQQIDVTNQGTQQNNCQAVVNQQSPISIEERFRIMKEELKKELKEESKKELKKELKEELKEEIKGELKEELKGELKEELMEELKKELKKELKEELKEEIKKELKEEIKG